MRGRVPYTKFTWHLVHKPYETGLKNSKCFCWKCLYCLTAKIDFSDLYSISGEELTTKEENWWTSYMELFPFGQQIEEKASEVVNIEVRLRLDFDAAFIGSVFIGTPSF